MRLLLTIALAATVAFGQESAAIPFNAPPPPMIPSASAVVIGQPGNGTHYYWIVAKYVGGNSSPAGPITVTSAPLLGQLSTLRFVKINWQAAANATGYDVLRTAVNSRPSGACDCALVTGTTDLEVLDIGAALSAYTVTTGVKAYARILLDNVNVATPKLRQDINGVISDIGSGGGGTVTAGTGILVSGSEVSINSAVTQTLANDQSKAAVYCRSTTGNDTYTCSLNPALTAYTRGMYVILDADTANTGAATLVIDGLSALSIVTRAGATPSNGDVVANRGTLLYYNGTDLSIVGDGGGGATTFKEVQYFRAAVSETNGVVASDTYNYINQNYTDTYGATDKAWPVIVIGDTNLKSIQFVTSVPPGLTNLDVGLDTAHNYGSSGAINFFVSVACLASGNNITSFSYNATANAGGTIGANNTLLRLTATAVPITGCDEGETMRINVQRDAGDASTNDVGLIGIRVVMTRAFN
jgi:hypothetical protein